MSDHQSDLQRCRCGECGGPLVLRCDDCGTLHSDPAAEIAASPCHTDDETVVKRQNEMAGGFRIVATHMRQARRKWRCSECGATIHPGDLYLTAGSKRYCDGKCSR